MERVDIVVFINYWLTLYIDGQLTCFNPQPPGILNLKFIRHKLGFSLKKNKSYFIVIPRLDFWLYHL